MLSFVAIANAQSTSEFAAGEGQRVYDLIDGLGCIGNANCTKLGDFTPTTACNYNINYLRCDFNGQLAQLYACV
jgi:hypothetical protein